MAKRIYGTERQTRCAQARSDSHVIVRSTTPHHRPPARYRTPRRPTLRRRIRHSLIGQTRRELAFLLVLLMFVLVLLSPLLSEAVVAFDKLLPFLTLVLGHYFGQK